jgi:magnesium chelatase family protein
MRQPLEDGRVTVSRAAGSLTFPCEFMLVAAMNPCPCGHFGDLRRECRCAPSQVQKYRNRLSGPLMDRIDIHIEVPAMELKDLTETSTEEDSATIRERVTRARFFQLKRFSGQSKVTCNARMTSRQLRKYCVLDPESIELLKEAVINLNLSARAYDRILKVARTIADLAASSRIQPDHLAEAVQYRALDRSLW